MSAGTVWSNSAGFAVARFPPPPSLPCSREHHQAPQGPDRKDMTYFKKKKRGRK